MSRKISRSRLWFNLLFPLACYFVFVYPVVRLGNWYADGGGPDIWHALLLWALSYFAMLYSFRGPNMKVRYVVVHWMGASFVFATLTLAAEAVRVLFTVSDPVLAKWVLVAGLVLILLAVLLSHHLSVKHFELKTPKVSRPWRIAQISDVHIGSRQGSYMQRIVDRINRLEPDFVVITGDLIDSSAVEFEALKSIAHLDARTFFTLGNHERYADVEKIVNIAQRLGVTTLRQSSVMEQELVFHGIDDADAHDHVAVHMPVLEVGRERYNVLLYHRPLGWEAAVEHGIDLMLSGHTHNGQIFPFNLVVRQQFSRISGMYEAGDARLYVSSGTGTWGPLMRLGSLNEISVFDIKPHD